MICISYFFTGCGKETDRQTFELDVIDKLPEKWKYFAVDAVENFLYQYSDRYDKSFLNVIEKEYPELFEKYRMIMRQFMDTWEAYQCSSESDKYNQLVKKFSELNRLQAKQLKDREEQAEESLKGISNRELGITTEMLSKEKKIMDDKYSLCIQLLVADKYEHYSFTIKNISEKDENLSMSKVAILYLYFKELPEIEVYFYKDPDNSNWVSFYSKINFGNYYIRKYYK